MAYETTQSYHQRPERSDNRDLESGDRTGKTAAVGGLAGGAIIGSMVGGAVGDSGSRGVIL